MAIITITPIDADALTFVLKGAGKSDCESLVNLDIDGPGVTISTQCGPNYRAMEIEAENPEGSTDNISLRAKPLESMLKNVEEGRSLTLQTDVDRVHVTCGSVSATLGNLYDYVPKVATQTPTEPVYSGADAVRTLSYILKSSRLAGKGIVSIRGEDDMFTIGTSLDDSYTQAVIDSHHGDDFGIDLYGQEIKPLSDMLKASDAMDTISIRQCSGLTSFEVAFTRDGEHGTQSLTLQVPKVVNDHLEDESPCNEDVDEVLVVDKSVLREALTSLKDVTSLTHGVIEIDLTQENRCILRASSPNATAKGVIVEGVSIYGDDAYSVEYQNLTKALGSITSSAVSLGIIDFDGHQWIAIQDGSDDEENEDEEISMIVAIARK